MATRSAIEDPVGAVGWANAKLVRRQKRAGSESLFEFEIANPLLQQMFLHRAPDVSGRSRGEVWAKANPEVRLRARTSFGTTSSRRHLLTQLSTSSIHLFLYQDAWLDLFGSFFLSMRELMPPSNLFWLPFGPGKFSPRFTPAQQFQAPKGIAQRIPKAGSGHQKVHLGDLALT